MLFQTRCAGCDRLGVSLCTTCRFALLGPAPVVSGVAAGADGAIAAVPYVGRARSIVLSLKYRNRRGVARHLAGVLVNRLVAAGAHSGLDVVTWAPTRSGRRRRRGYDQAEIVARTVARQLGVPCRALLRRCDAGPPQTGQLRAARLNGPAFVARPGLGGQRILVIDDVVTSGGTLAAARAALGMAGADQVRLAAVAATPLDRQHRRREERSPVLSTVASPRDPAQDDRAPVACPDVDPGVTAA